MSASVKGGAAALRGPFLNMLSGGFPSASAPGSTARAGASGRESEGESEGESELPGASALPGGSAGTSGTCMGAAGAGGTSGGTYEDDKECFGNSLAGVPLRLGQGENM